MAYIPNVPEERVVELAQRIEPIVRIGDAPRYIKPVDLNRIAFMWSPEATGYVDMNGLVALRDITTYHTWAYYGFFKPTIAEVLKQIPTEIVDQVVAFEIIESPQCAEDFDKDREAFNAGYHVATTRLYGKGVSEAVAGLMEGYYWVRVPEHLHTPNVDLARLENGRWRWWGGQWASDEADFIEVIGDRVEPPIPQE